MQSRDSEPHPTGGGSATTAGINFQSRVAAWLATRILSEGEAEPLWDWEAGSSLRFIRCETEQPVDDILVGNSKDGLAFIQVKRGMSAGTGVESALISAFEQFVRQYLRPEIKAGSQAPWHRKFDPTRDRLILAVSPDSSGRITDIAPKALKKFTASPAADLEGPGFNDEERDVLGRIRKCVEAGWQKNSGRLPTTAEIRTILGSVRILSLSVEDDGADELQAKDLLRRSVLRSPDAAAATWAILIKLCAAFGTTRSGADAKELRTKLAADGISLRAPQSFRQDIAKLEEYSAATIKTLKRFSEIRVGSTTLVKFHRKSTDALLRAATKSSLLLIGEPGAGKSGALYDLVSQIQSSGAAVLCLATDEVASDSIASLQNELGIQHSLLEVLSNWGSTERPVFLVTDALDAARTDHAGSMFRKLIEGTLELNDSCRVVASIRMFDLQNDIRLKALFKGKPHEDYHSGEFSGLRHFLVPVLSAEELRQVALQSPALDRLITATIASANEDMKRLIVFPFNLRLLGELIGEGASVDSLTPIRTQIELLDRYWNERVIDTDGLGDARETLLRKIARVMFRNRALHANRSTLDVGPQESVLLNALLSSNLLQEYRPGSEDGLGRHTLKFSHHLIFDYAVSRLLMRGDHSALEALIVDDPDCVVAFRPSLVLHFRHLWGVDLPEHNSFWSLLIRLEQAPGIPLVGKIIGPSVAAEQFATIGDFSRLVTEARGFATSEDGRRLAVQLVSHLLGAQAARGGVGRANIGESERWADFARELSTDVAVFAYPLRHLLTMLCNPATGIPAEAKPGIGAAGRALLEFTLSDDRHYDPSLVRCSLEAVARTFNSDSSASASALRRLLTPEHAAQYGHNELFFLAQEIPRLLEHDVSLVAEIYRVAYSCASKSDEQTYLGGRSRIMPLLSNKRQDWEGVHYALAEKFHEFVAASPIEATRVAIVATELHVQQEHARKEPGDGPSSILFLGTPALIATDYSSIWDSDGGIRSRDSSALKLLDETEKFIATLAETESDSGQILNLLQELANSARSAVIWRRIIRLGATHPKKIGKLFWEIITQRGVLSCFDIHHEIGDLIAAVYELLGEEEQIRIEKALLAYPEAGSETEEIDSDLRDRFLGCIPRTLVRSEAAKSRLAELDRADGPPRNVPNFRSSGFTESIVGDEDFLRHRGVPVDDPANRDLLALIRPLKVDSSSGKPTPPNVEAPDLRLRRLMEIEVALKENRASSEVLHQAQAYHAEACSTALASVFSPDVAQLKDYARRSLLRIAATEAEGELTTREGFDRMPSWGSPNAPIAAVEGLIRSEDILSDAERREVDDAILKLSRSPEPEIRFQVARYVGCYATRNPERMWELLRFFAEKDPSAGVVTAALATIARSTLTVALDLAETAFARSSTFGEHRGPRDSCLGYFIVRYVRDEVESVLRHLVPIVDRPWLELRDTHHLLSHLRDGLAFGSATDGTDKEAGIRKRSQEILKRILLAANVELERMYVIYSSSRPEDIPQADKDTIESLHRCLNSVGDHVYFASGAFELRTDKSSPPKLDLLQRQRFWNEMKDILKILSRTRSAHVSYHLIETLESLTQFAPKEVFIEIAKTVQLAKSGGFQYESLVADLAVRAVSEFIATQRGLLREDKESRTALVEILDTFVEAGWPAAQKLTFGLEDIFR